MMGGQLYPLEAEEQRALLLEAEAEVEEEVTALDLTEAAALTLKDIDSLLMKAVVEVEEATVDHAVEHTEAAVVDEEVEAGVEATVLVVALEEDLVVGLIKFHMLKLVTLQC